MFSNFLEINCKFFLHISNLLFLKRNKFFETTIFFKLIMLKFKKKFWKKRQSSLSLKKQSSQFLTVPILSKCGCLLQNLIRCFSIWTFIFPLFWPWATTLIPLIARENITWDIFRNRMDASSIFLWKNLLLIIQNNLLSNLPLLKIAWLILNST